MAYRDKNKRKEYMKNFRLKNRERLYAYARSYYQKNKETWWKYRFDKNGNPRFWYNHKPHNYTPKLPKNPDYFSSSTLTSKVSIWRNGKGVFEVIKRDGKKCKNCRTEKNLTIHHLDHKGRHALENGTKPNNSPENLVILCRRCHALLHPRPRKYPYLLK